jgi:hypothetical protein
VVGRIGFGNDLPPSGSVGRKGNMENFTGTQQIRGGLVDKKLDIKEET